MDILLHVCCGPCTIYPLQALRDRGLQVEGYFHNPNIHPFREFRRRIEALQELARQMEFEVTVDEEYGLRQYLRQVVYKEDGRCRLCYAMRLDQAAQRAASLGADAYTSTLLYSRYQDHEAIRDIAETAARRHNIVFYYDDFRQGWQEGIERSKAMGLYRQPYCGCIYSEQERYDKRLRQRSNNLQPKTSGKEHV